MTPARFAQVKQIFLEAVSRPVAERERFLTERCGADVELKREVAALLAAHTEIAPSATHVSRAGTQTAGAQAQPSGSGPKAGPTEARGFEPGTVVADRFRIVALLGQGGMGEVYRADDLTLDQPVALKFLPLDLAADAQARARLYHEVRLARTITHPAVCRVYDINEVAGEHFISMEYVDGEDLRTLFKRIGRLPVDKAADLARQLCAGLAAAHARGVLHRDLKPANVMLDGAGRIRILDFGLAALHDQVGVEDIRAGTPAYMAPEQIAGTEVTVRSDIYSLGLVLYELFTGQPAFPRALPIAARAATPPAPPSTVVPEIAPATERIILRCLQAECAGRPASVLEVMAALPGGDALQLAQELGVTPSPTVVASTERQVLSRRAAATLMLAFVGLLTGAVAFGPRTHPLCLAEPAKPPAVLAEKAREQLARSGLGRAPWQAYGFLGGLPSGTDDRPRASADRLAVDSRQLLFWYRCRPAPLVPQDAERLVFGGARATVADPPLDEPGEALLVLDGGGRLRSARLVPFPAEDRASPPDWNTWHASAALNPASLAPVEAESTPPVLADQRWSWRAASAADSNRLLRVDAAAYLGQPVWYSVADAVPDAAAAAELADTQRRQTVVYSTSFVVLAALLVSALPLIRRWHGQSDARRATRLAVLVAAAAVVSALLQATHVPSLVDEFRLLTLAITGAVGKGLVVWLLYLSLEPLARRYWPQLLVSWTRALGGQLRDPLIGRDLLIGAVLGVAGTVLFQLEQLVPPAVGVPMRPRLLAHDFFTPCLSLRESIAFTIDALRMGVYTALWLTLAVALLRYVLHRAMLVGVAVALLLALYLVPRSSEPLFAFVFLAIGVGGSLVWTMLRYGLVPGAVAITIMLILLRLPLTYDLHAWYAEWTVMALLLTVAVAIYGLLNGTQTARLLISRPPMSFARQRVP